MIMNTELNNKILKEFWDQHATHNPGMSITDFEVTWREGYVFYYDIREKATGVSVSRCHADVVDPATDPMIIADLISRATKQILSGDAEFIDDPDNFGNPPRSKVEPKSVEEWLKDD